MSVSHSPGPWESKYDGHGGMCINDANGQQVGYVCKRNGGVQEANAKLIDAAPDSLAMLQRLLAWFDAEAELVRETGTGSTEGELIDQAVAIKSVIAKCRKLP